MKHRLFMFCIWFVFRKNLIMRLIMELTTEGDSIVKTINIGVICIAIIKDIVRSSREHKKRSGK